MASIARHEEGAVAQEFTRIGPARRALVDLESREAEPAAVAADDERRVADAASRPLDAPRRLRAALRVGREVGPPNDDSPAAGQIRQSSQVDDDVASRLGAADENVAVGRLVEWFGSVSDCSRN